MKKALLTVFIGLLTAGAFAQTTATTIVKTDKQNHMKDLRKDVRDERPDRKLRRYEVKHHDKAAAQNETKDIKGDNKDIHGDVRHLRKDGVNHPIKRVDRQIHRHLMNGRH